MLFIACKSRKQKVITTEETIEFPKPGTDVHTDSLKKQLDLQRDIRNQKR